MTRFEEIVLKQAQEARDGKVLAIPLQLDRIGDELSLRKKVYTIIGSNPGVGKSAFLDSVYVLGPYEAWRKAKEMGIAEYSFKSIYVAAERPEAEKLAKWACWKLYQEHKLQVSVEVFLGFKKVRATDEVWKLFVQSKDWIEELLDHVDFKSYSMTPNEFSSLVDYHALKDGLLVKADTIGIKEQDSDNYSAFFSMDKTKKRRSGELVQYIDYQGPDGKVHEIEPGKQLYFPKREKEIVQVVYDHVGKTKGEGSDKERTDKLSQIASEARDVYGYSPVFVSQFNRAIGNVERAKLYKNDLSPNLDDFKNTGNLVEDCDVAITLFNPLRFKAYDDKGFYRGYNIRNRMVTARGQNRFRLLGIHKNSYGSDDLSCGLKFLGEVMHFQTLPRVEDEESLELAYRQIAMGL